MLASSAASGANQVVQASNRAVPNMIGILYPGVFSDMREVLHELSNAVTVP